LRTAAGIRKVLTVVPLGNAILYPSALSQVGDLGPVFIWICRAPEGAAGAVSGDMPRRSSSRVVVAVSRHDERLLVKCSHVWSGTEYR
jgi:hypothetical protein